jgi:hypothetical protein
VCVLKFSLEDRGNKLDHEFQIWKKAYPQFKVYRENWCGHPALRMPHFAMVKDEKRAQMVGLVRKSPMTNFAVKNMKHNDVYWRNIGIYTNRNGNEEAVVFDMGSVVTGVEDSSWWTKHACVSREINVLNHKNGVRSRYDIGNNTDVETGSDTL